MSKVSDAVSRATDAIQSVMEGMTTGEKEEFLETLCDDLDDMIDEVADDVPAGGREEEDEEVTDYPGDRPGTDR